MTDVSDVFVMRDPFILIKDKSYDDKIFVGTNVVGMGAKKRTPMWFERRKWKLETICC